MTDSDKQQKHFFSHVDRWKDLYQLFGVVIALAISALAIWQSSSALRIQKEEFHLRNRPLVDITAAKFSGPAVDDSDGRKYPRTIELDIGCISDVPAKNFKALCNVMLNDKRVANTSIKLGALAKGKSWICGIYLSDAIYEAATNADNHFWVDFKGTYSGMLDEAIDQYGLSFQLRYSPVPGRFGFSNREYR